MRTERTKAGIFVFYLMFLVGVSCRILHSFVGYLYASGSGSIASVGEERAYIFVCC